MYMSHVLIRWMRVEILNLESRCSDLRSIGMCYVFLNFRFSAGLNNKKDNRLREASCVAVRCLALQKI